MKTIFILQSPETLFIFLKPEGSFLSNHEDVVLIAFLYLYTKVTLSGHKYGAKKVDYFQTKKFLI
jgi:hypothetical protein